MNTLTLAEAIVLTAVPAGTFEVVLGSDDRVACDAALRQLPGKRQSFGGEWQGQRVVLKVFQSRRHFCRERDKLLELAALQLPVPGLLATSADGAPGPYYVIMSWLANEGTLRDAWLRSAVAERTTLLHSAVALIATMHRAGCVQRDLHWENCLVDAGPDMTLSMIDVSQVDTGVSAARALEDNLALFLAQLDPDSDTLLPAALAAYENPAWQPTGSIHARIDALRRKRLQRHGEKCLRNASAFRVRRNRGCFVAVHLPAGRDFVGETPAGLDLLIERGELLKAGNTATVASAQVGDEWVNIKRYNIKGFGHWLSRFWRPSRAINAWRSAHQLLLLGIATPLPLAVIEQRVGPLRHRGYLLTRQVAGSSLKDYLAGTRAAGPGIPAWLDTQLQRLFTVMRAYRLSHGDLKATNLLICDNTLMLIDLDAMQPHRTNRGFERAFHKDLKRFLANWRDGDRDHFDQLLAPFFQSPNTDNNE